MIYLLVIIVAVLESILFAQFPIFYVVLPVSLVLLMHINENFTASYTLLFAVIIGFVIDSLRTGYAPSFLLAYTIVAAGLIIWRKYRKRPITDRILKPLVALSVAALLWQAIVILPIYEAIDLAYAAVYTAWMLVILAITWLASNYIINRFV